MLVTGKGGVGKSTVATALALSAARSGCRPLLVEAGARASLRALLGTTLGPAPAAVGDGVFGLSLAGDAALPVFAADVLRSRRLANLLLGHRSISALLRALPAVAEIAAMHVLERHKDYAPLVVDLEATGHARMWFELRDTLAPLISRGPIAELLSRAQADLADPSCTALVLVTRPEPLAVSEAIELYEDLRQRGGVVPHAIVVNATTTAAASSEELSALIRRARERGAHALVRDVEHLMARSCAAQREREAAKPLWDTGVPMLWMPRLPHSDRAALTDMGTHIAAALFEPSARAGLPEAVGWT